MQSAELKESKGRSRLVGIHFISQCFVKWLALHVLSQGSGPMTHLHVFESPLMRARAWGDRDGEAGLVDRANLRLGLFAVGIHQGAGNASPQSVWVPGFYQLGSF